jgi:DNA-binding LacI/PurR family transcriptional regulator
MNKAERHHHIRHLVEQSGARTVLSTRELAAQFGVSEMTVRRDLHELSEDGLLHRQHGGATSLRRPRQHQHREIGILLVSKKGKFSDPFFNAVLEGVDRKLQDLGYRIAYIKTWIEVNTAEQARALLESQDAGGVILLGTPVGVESAEYLKSHVRAITKTADLIIPDEDNITFDGYYGMRKMVDHLVNLGYRRLGYITGTYETRYDGFVGGIRAHSLPDDPQLRVRVPFGLDGWTPELAYMGVEQLMHLSNPPDAIVCASDRIAIGAIQWLHQHGLRVPEDIAVTGFDDIAESAFTTPPLTTVHVHKELIGELAAERIVRLVENEQEIPLVIQTPTYLVVRRSCGSPG